MVSCIHFDCPLFSLVLRYFQKYQNQLFSLSVSRTNQQLMNNVENIDFSLADCNLVKPSINSRAYSRTHIRKTWPLGNFSHLKSAFRDFIVFT